ncbi:MAG: class I SAM-dependent methyltransferase [Smithella sp.]|jgi:O-antigen chain-terminating methyltransferase
MNLSFYHTFKEKYQGLHEFRESRLAICKSLVEALKVVYAGGRAVDLDCGRGEWLEIVGELGFHGVGVGLDEDMLAACRERGLNVERKESIAYLKTLPESSVVIVSGFPVTLHMPFSKLKILVQEALRVLLPGGLLILEVPNPETVMAFTRNFYLDQTHQQLIFPQLLSFLPEYYGFARARTICFWESKDLIQSSSDTRQYVLEGVRPGYAVIAQKAADEEIHKTLNAAFAVDYGVRLETLATHYQIELKTTIQQATERTVQAEAALDATRKELHEIHQSNQYHSQLAEVHKRQLQELLNSTSWRITSPLRWIVSTLRCLTPSALKNGTRLVLQHAVLYTGRRPRLQKAVSRVLNLFPGLQSRLFRINIGMATPPVQPQETPIPVQPQETPIAAAHLSHLARQIYNNLKVAVEQYRKGQG